MVNETIVKSHTKVRVENVAWIITRHLNYQMGLLFQLLCYTGNALEKFLQAVYFLQFTLSKYCMPTFTVVTCENNTCLLEFFSVTFIGNT